MNYYLGNAIAFCVCPAPPASVVPIDGIIAEGGEDDGLVLQAEGGIDDGKGIITETE